MNNRAAQKSSHKRVLLILQTDNTRYLTRSGFRWLTQNGRTIESCIKISQFPKWNWNYKLHRLEKWRSQFRPPILSVLATFTFPTEKCRLTPQLHRFSAFRLFQILMSVRSSASPVLNHLSISRFSCVCLQWQIFHNFLMPLLNLN